MKKQITKNKAQGTRNKVQDKTLVLILLGFCSCFFVPCFLVSCLVLVLIFASMKILMVCLGNICRSPLAEGILQHKAIKAGLNWIIDSAGTNGYHVGDAPHRLSQKIAMLHGIDISNQCGRKFVKEDFDRFDKIYALAKDVLNDIKWIAKEKFDNKKATLLLDELYPGQNADVPDPWSGPEAGYHEAFELIDTACEKIIQKYSVENFIKSYP